MTFIQSGWSKEVRPSKKLTLLTNTSRWCLFGIFPLQQVGATWFKEFDSSAYVSILGGPPKMPPTHEKVGLQKMPHPTLNVWLLSDDDFSKQIYSEANQSAAGRNWSRSYEKIPHWNMLPMNVLFQEISNRTYWTDPKKPEYLIVRSQLT